MYAIVYVYVCMYVYMYMCVYICNFNAKIKKVMIYVNVK